MNRHLADVVAYLIEENRVLIRDRDCLFTVEFKGALETAGVRTVLTPALAPNCNAYAERFVLSIKSECLGRMIFFGDNSLRRAYHEFVEHDHHERAHQGLATSVSCAGRPWGPAKWSARSALAGS